jgi:hypothetical protein
MLNKFVFYETFVDLRSFSKQNIFNGKINSPGRGNDAGNMDGKTGFH